MKRFRFLSVLFPLVIATVACDASKSSNPLSPTVAGPIPGVEISAPRLIEPGANWQVDSTKQPLTLLIENSSSSGVRPVTYTVEIANDANFTNILFKLDGVPPGEGGRTTLRLPDALSSGRTYYWRARALDGANSSPYSATVNFNVFTPVVIAGPVLHAPVNNVVLTERDPRFSIGNAPRSGPAGQVVYTIEIAEDPGFGNKAAIWLVTEQPNETILEAPANLNYGRQYFWRAQGADNNTIGPWSATQSFQTPPIPVAPAPGSGGGGGGPVGDWQQCSALVANKEALSACVRNAVNPGSSAEAAFEVTKRVAWLLRGEGGGLLIKDGGENIVFWQGRWFAAGRICYSGGHIFKVLTDVGGANGAGWADEGFVEANRYVPAIQP